MGESNRFRMALLSIACSSTGGCDPVFDPLTETPTQPVDTTMSADDPPDDPPQAPVDAGPPKFALDAGSKPEPRLELCERGVVSSDERYMFCPLLVSHEQASEQCQSRGMRLVTIPSAAVEAELVALMGGFMSSFWTGGRRERGVWRWRDGRAFGDNATPGETNTPHINWREQEPNNDQGEDCLEVHIAPTVEWNDTECVNRRPFVCEREAASEPPVDRGSELGFFVTSSNPDEMGGNLGGLSGADAFCEQLAEAVGADDRQWRAYLSTDAEDARDRIGAGPWKNAYGVVIATSVDDLHSSNNRISKLNAVTEVGAVVNGENDEPNFHDIFTGSQEDGTLAADKHNCNNWTSNLSTHHARVGHHDRVRETSWNSAHDTSGCSIEDLRAFWSDGRFYCFAADPN